MMICCNTGARTRRLMMTRARFRAYSVHRVLDEFLEIWRVEELVDNRNVLLTFCDFCLTFGVEEPPPILHCISEILMEMRKKHLQNIIVRVKNTFSGSHLTLTHSWETRPHVVALACNTKRANSLTSSHDESSGYTSRLKNELQSCMRGGEIWFLWRRKDIQWSISFSLSLARASVHVWWDDELFQFDFHAHWRVSIFASYHLIHYYYNVNCEY